MRLVLDARAFRSDRRRIFGYSTSWYEIELLFGCIGSSFLPLEPLSQKGKVIRYYLMAVTFYGIIWFVLFLDGNLNFLNFLDI